jgi:hypothetical protein
MPRRHEGREGVLDYARRGRPAAAAAGRGHPGEVSGFTAANIIYPDDRIKAGAKTLRLTTFTMPAGKLEQYQVAAD